MMKHAYDLHTVRNTI